MMRTDDFAGVNQVANALSQKLDADIILINGPSRDSVFQRFVKIMASITEKKPNVFLILVTNGGSPDSAYLTARHLQREYQQVTVCINGDCYSAGTLTVLGAHEVVVSDTGKLGPLDVQILKRDEIGERLSGLTVNIAMEQLSNKTYETFLTLLVNLKTTFRGQISFRTAMDVASTMSTNLYSEVFKQIDPLKIGEDARAMQIAKHYGERLNKTAHNVKENAIDRLLEEYPSHSCVIDRDEAKEIFNNVRSPEGEEIILLELLGAGSRVGKDDATEAIILHLSKAPATNGKRNETTAAKSKRGTTKAKPGARSRTPARNGKAGEALALPNGRNGAAGGRRRKATE